MHIYVFYTISMSFRSNLLQYVCIFKILAGRKYVKYKAFTKKSALCLKLGQGAKGVN